MRRSRAPHPGFFFAAGLIGLALFFAGQRARLPFIPADDFDKGIWFGGCIGLEIIGVFYAVRNRLEPEE